MVEIYSFMYRFILGYKKGKPRRYGSNTQSSAGAELCDRDSHVSKAFMEYKELLDNKHDKHENLVKISRDVTIESKRIIFQLHRAVGYVKLTCTELYLHVLRSTYIY